MKKIYFLLILSFISINTFSQNIGLFDNEYNYSNGDTLYTYGMENESVIYAYINTVNLGSATVSLKVRRHTISIISGTENYFCWGQCYGPSVDTSERTMQIQAGDTIYEFQGEYKPQMHPGTSIIRYVFYNVNNLQDTMSIIVFYNAEPLGITTPSGNSQDISNAFPNPASDFTSIKYSLPKTNSNTKFILRDCLGSIIREDILSEYNGKITLNLSGLKQGIYFYSFISDNTIIITKKLVVK